MVNTSTPASYVPLQTPQIEAQAQVLVTQSGVISSGTYFLELASNNGIKLGGANNTTNLQFFGVNDTSSNFQDVEVFVTGVL